MREIVRSESDKLQKGDSDQQYLVFAHVSVDDLAEIDRARNSIGKGTRMTHYTDINLLIVKLPTAEHELAHGNLANKVCFTLARMGMPDREFQSVGATTYRVRGSAKEGDSAYRPRSFRLNNAD
jgi:ribosomal protein L11